MKQLIDDVNNGSINCKAILVYDVSRWGRFQDVDQGAYYEYICKRAGVSVHYCAEMFENDDSIVSVVFKNVKRAMAGEYSRELSSKVFKGQCRLIELGYRQGGVAGYGLRRMRVDQHGNQLGILGKGEYKSLQTDRVILVPGPSEEVELVRMVFDLFVQANKPEKDIANHLNMLGLKYENDQPWSRGRVHQLLISEKYIGNNVFNRTSFKLKKKRVRNSPDLWVRGDGAFKELIDLDVFVKAQRIILNRSKKLSNDEMLQCVKTLLLQRGSLSGIVIDEAEGIPSSSAYQTRFGGLMRVYKLIGYTPARDYQYVEDNKRLRKTFSNVVDEMLRHIRELGGHVSKVGLGSSYLVNNELQISVIISRCKQTRSGHYRWRMRFERDVGTELTIAVRMDHLNEFILDYYVFPKVDVTFPRLLLGTHNGLQLDAYRCETLDFFYSLIERVKIRGAA